MNDIHELHHGKYGSLQGLCLTIVVGFVLFFVLNSLPDLKILPDYKEIVGGINSFPNQLAWFLMNFTEGEFYAGIITTLGLLLGAVIAWQLAIHGKKNAGIEICYGSARIWPWVFASQVLSLFFTEYLFGYIHLFGLGNAWIPTFIVIVGVPPSMVLMYGPGWKTLFTASILGAVMCTPVAYGLAQMSAFITIPGATYNVLAMAITGIIAGATCNCLPWMEKKPCLPTNNPNQEQGDYYSITWNLRRVLADLTEPQFYGNDVAGFTLIVAVIIEWTLCRGLLGGGAKALPAIILSQFISGGLGVFLYTKKYQENGWYATYVPVVCSAPAAVLMFGPKMSVILIASILGGIIGAPIAEWFGHFKPDYVHGTVNNVFAMALSTVITQAVLYCIPWI